MWIAYDRDDAGDAGGRAAQKNCSMGIECHRVLFPQGMDANEYALKVSLPGAELRRAAQQNGKAATDTHRAGS